MITEEKIKTVLEKRYGYRVFKVYDLEELKKAFKIFHKILSGEANANIIGRWRITDKYIRKRDSSCGKIKALSEVVDIRPI